MGNAGFCPSTLLTFADYFKPILIMKAPSLTLRVQVPNNHILS